MCLLAIAKGAFMFCGVGAEPGKTFCLFVSLENSIVREHSLDRGFIRIEL